MWYWFIGLMASLHHPLPPHTHLCPLHHAGPEAVQREVRQLVYGATRAQPHTCQVQGQPQSHASSGWLADANTKEHLQGVRVYSCWG